MFDTLSLKHNDPQVSEVKVNISVTKWSTMEDFRCKNQKLIIRGYKAAWQVFLLLTLNFKASSELLMYN